MSEWITAAEAARILGVSQVALAHHRKRGTGPAWIDQRKPGAKNAKPVYDRASVEAYGDKRKRQKDGRSYVERLEALEARLAAPSRAEMAAKIESLGARLAKVERQKAIKRRRALSGLPV